MPKAIKYGLLATVVLAAGFSAATFAVSTPSNAKDQVPQGSDGCVGHPIPAMVTVSDGRVDQMQVQLSESFDLLAQSIKDGDISGTMSRNEAVTAMKGLVKLSEDNLLTMREKAARKDTSGVEHECVKITIAWNAVQGYHAQVRSSSGALSLDLTNVEQELVNLNELELSTELADGFSVVLWVFSPPTTTSPDN